MHTRCRIPYVSAATLLCVGCAGDVASAQSADDQRAPEEQATPTEQIQRGGVELQPTPSDADREGGHAVNWAIPALAVPDYKPKASDLLREGALVHRMQGRLLGSPGGGRVFVFDQVEGQPAPAPMIVMPSVRLTEMERLLSSRTAGVTFLVTGEAFVYHGRNYLLPSGFTTRQRELEKEQAEQTPDGSQGDDEAGELIEALRQQAQNRPDSRSAPGTPRRQIARDGDMVVAERGRVRRGGSGGWEFVRDTDATTGVRPDARDEQGPHVLLPCLLLEAIEGEIGDENRGAELVMSGAVHVYDGRSYLLPTSYRLVRDDVEGLSSGQ